jgi:hypothetical protein
MQYHQVERLVKIMRFCLISRRDAEDEHTLLVYASNLFQVLDTDMTGQLSVNNEKEWRTALGVDFNSFERVFLDILEKPGVSIDRDKFVSWATSNGAENAKYHNRQAGECSMQNTVMLSFSQQNTEQ